MMHGYDTPHDPPREPDAPPVPLLDEWRRFDALEDLAHWTGRARLVALAAAAGLGVAVLIAGG